MKRKHHRRPTASPAGSAAGRPSPPRTTARAPGPSRPSHRPERRDFPGSSDAWLYGVHAVLAAVANPARDISRIVLADDAAADLRARLEAARTARPTPCPEIALLPRAEFERFLPRGAVHQGIAAAARPLPELDVDDLIRRVDGQDIVRIVVLDQVTDPHNVGAILRSAAAFACAGVVIPERHAPGTSAVMAKAASGAFERVPLVRVVNLARALDQLKEAGIWCIGLAGDGAATLADSDLTGRVALVLGAEGEGLRRLTRERCDAIVRIPIAADAVESLNVSNAAAIALYELARRRTTPA